MKLKFRAEPQDILIFVLFAIFLLYVVCLGVLNLPVLLTEGEFYGLLPFEAFNSENISVTIVLYFLFLIGIFFSVSSYFFDREEGFGFSTTKKSKGYSRWAKEKEIQSELKRVDIASHNADAAGVPLIIKDNEIWVDDGEYHSLVIGATGSGKTQTVIFPTVESLAKKGESMIITDPKGEIYEGTANMLKDRGYDIVVLNFRDPQQGGSWNPLTLPYEMYRSGNQDKAIELLDDLAANILYEENSGNADPFWEKTSADYFSGLALGMFEDAKPEEVNINTISLMTTDGEEKCGGSTFAKEYFDMKSHDSPAYVNASGTIMAPSETKGSIISVFKQKIKLFASRENLSEMLSYSDVKLDEIGEKPTALFIIIQDEKKTYHSLVTILLKQCYETLISTAQKHGGKLPVRTNFLLDEFANMPPLKDITTMITAARSRKIRFTMIIQNFAQLDQVYGKENAETIRGNCGNIIYLITTELKALEEISKMCGEEKSKKDDKTASTPLVTVSDLQRMKQFEIIILRIRMQPFKTKFVPYYKLKDRFGNNYEKATYPTREKRPVQVFDIKEFVKLKRQEKIKSMMEGNSNQPSSGGMPFPPMFGNPNNTSPFSNLPKRPINDEFSNQPMPKNNSLNIDDLVKKIDAKLAQIEEEEKQMNVKPVENKSDVIKSVPKDENTKPVLFPNMNKPKDDKPIIKESPRIIVDERPNNSIKESEIIEKPIIVPKPNKEVQENIENKVNNVISNNVNSVLEDKIEKPREVKEINLEEGFDEDKFFDDFFDDN